MLTAQTLCLNSLNSNKTNSEVTYLWNWDYPYEDTITASTWQHWRSLRKPQLGHLTFKPRLKLRPSCVKSGTHSTITSDPRQ